MGATTRGPKVAAAAQAQALQQVNINHTESLELVRHLLRVSIFHLAYLRGLFPDGSFKGCDMKNLDGMHIKVLMPTCDESRRLIDWVDGVYDAIKQGYLKNLFFGVSTDPDGTHLLEEFIFSFTYGEDGHVGMDVEAKAKGKDCGVSKDARKKGGKDGKQPPLKADLDSVRYQVCRLMRMLVQICQTLDKVPSQRFLFMKLTYHEHTPDDYDPPFFVPVEESAVGHFKRQPFSMAVGTVATDHHCVALKVMSVLDACDDLQEDADAGGAVAEPVVSMQSTSACTDGDEADGRMDADDEAGFGHTGGGDYHADGHSPCGGQSAPAKDRQKQAAAAAAAEDPRRRAKADMAALMSAPQPDHPHHAGMDIDTGDRCDGAASEEDLTEAPMAEAFYDVQAFALGRKQVDMRELACHFSSVPEEELGRFVALLVQQGALAGVPGQRGAYMPARQPARGKAGGQRQAEVESGRRAAPEVQAPDAASPAPPPSPQQPAGAEQIAAQMDGLRVGADAVVALSLAARMQSAKDGDELTTSVAAGYSSKRGAGALAEGGAAEGGDACEPFEPPVKYMQDSQASNPARRGARRKASYVADPIQQGPAAKKTRSTATAAGTAAPPPPAAVAGTPAPRAKPGSRLAGMRR